MKQPQRDWQLGEAAPAGRQELPKNAFGLESRGETKRRLDDIPGAIADFTQSLAASSATRDDRQFSYVHRGMAETDKGDFVAAMGDFTQVLAVDPRCADALFGRGVLALKLGQKDAAQKDFDMAVASKPASEATWPQS